MVGGLGRAQALRLATWDDLVLTGFVVSPRVSTRPETLPGFSSESAVSRTPSGGDQPAWVSAAGIGIGRFQPPSAGFSKAGRGDGEVTDSRSPISACNSCNAGRDATSS